MTDFILEKLFEGLKELELHALGQAADIVMGFDQGGRIAVYGNALDNIRIQGSLGQKLGLADRRGGFFKDADEFSSDDFPFFFQDR